MAEKFLFDTDFYAEDAAAAAAVAKAEEEQAPPEPTFSAAELDQARADGLAEGRAAGLAEGRAETDRLAAQAVAEASARLAEIAETVRTHRDAISRDATAVASAVIRKVAPNLIHRGALDAIEAAIADCLPDLMEEPRIVIRVHNEMLDAVQSRVEPVLAASGFAGDIVIIPDQELAATDCSVEWADGGVRHDPSRVWRDIEEILRAHLDAPETESSATGASERGAAAPQADQHVPEAADDPGGTD